MGQFKSFSPALTQRVSLLGLQYRDMAALNDLVFSVVLGMMVYQCRSGRPSRRTAAHAYQNLFYLRGLFDKAEEGIADELGVE